MPPPTDQNSVPHFRLLVPATPENFDEAGYLRANPDVAAAVAAGQVPSGRHHFDAFGRDENRRQRIALPMEWKDRKLGRVRRLLHPDVAHRETLPHVDCLTDALREQFRIVPTDNVSEHDYDHEALRIINGNPDGLVLDCGAGQRNVYYDNVVNYEVVAYDSTDVLGVAEQLPFRDGSFDAVICLNVLEHVKDPFAVARELMRVLKPGGQLMCVAPFLQPLHGYPHHYFNMTAEGLTSLFEPLADKRITIYGAMQPIWALNWFLRSYAMGLPKSERTTFQGMTVSDLMATATKLEAEPISTQLSHTARTELAAAHALFGRKTDNISRESRREMSRPTPIHLKGRRLEVLRASTITYTPSVGTLLDGAKRNSEPAKIEFPAIFADQHEGEILYSAAWAHAMRCNGTLVTAHSLVATMHPAQRHEVESKWTSAINDQAVPLSPVKTKGPVYVACNEGSGTWGHWLVHNLPRALVFLDLVPDGRIVLPADYLGGRYKACSETLRSFGIGPEHCIYLRRDQFLHADSTWTIDLPYQKGFAHPLVFELFQHLRQRLRLRDVSEPAARGLSYIRRSVANREVANSEELENLIVNFGGAVVENAGTLEDQSALWRSTNSISGVLGSDLTNMLIGEVERLFVFSPAWFGDNFFYGLAAGLGIEWNEILCSELVTERTPKHRSSFAVPIDRATAFLANA